jgi:hypothetical protein
MSCSIYQQMTTSPEIQWRSNYRSFIYLDSVSKGPLLGLIDSEYLDNRTVFLSMFGEIYWYIHSRTSLS